MVRYDNSGNINYDLATNVAVSDADTKYTVDIRSDVNWTDGKPLTTKDILFTIDLMRNPSVRSVIAGWEDINVTAISDYRIEFKLKPLTPD